MVKNPTKNERLFRVMNGVIGSDAQVKNLITTCTNTNLTQPKMLRKLKLYCNKLELKERICWKKHQSV
jgi:HKD family nuclease